MWHFILFSSTFDYMITNMHRMCLYKTYLLKEDHRANKEKQNSRPNLQRNENQITILLLFLNIVNTVNSLIVYV